MKTPIATAIIIRDIAQPRRNGTAEICAIPRNACKPLTTSYAQQKLAHLMPRTKLIQFDYRACPHQIPERFGSVVRYPHRCQISSDLWLRARFKASRRFLLPRFASLDLDQRMHDKASNIYHLQR
jgi:hypothetical protein